MESKQGITEDVLPQIWYDMLQLTISTSTSDDWGFTFSHTGLIPGQAQKVH